STNPVPARYIRAIATSSSALLGLFVPLGRLLHQGHSSFVILTLLACRRLSGPSPRCTVNHDRASIGFYLWNLTTLELGGRRHDDSSEPPNQACHLSWSAGLRGYLSRPGSAWLLVSFARLSPLLLDSMKYHHRLPVVRQRLIEQAVGWELLNQVQQLPPLASFPE